MGIFSASTWTGPGWPEKIKISRVAESTAATATIEAVRTEPAKTEPAHPAERKVIVRPAQSHKLKARVDNNLMPATSLAEYKRVAAEVGIPLADVLVEEFRAFLVEHDIPTFNHQEVVKYMDEIAAKDNPTKLGWHWCPMRPKDTEIGLTFGRPAKRERDWNGNGHADKVTTASDFYESHRFQELAQRDHQPSDWRTATSPAYTRTLPLHALKKVALIERNFKAAQIVFLVTDYTIAPHIIVDPDPFLMAVIPNSAVSHGKGRFIIDVWDEPGFGIERMLK